MDSTPPDPLRYTDLQAEQSRWFTEEVRPHESALRGYLNQAFPTLHDVDDIVQESYLRVWKARATQKIEFARAFLFKVARHVALDSVRHKQRIVVDSITDLTDLPVIVDALEISPQKVNEKIKLLAEAIGSLPERRREIIVLHKLNRLSQKEVAARLGLSERTVENQIFRGMRQCEKYLRARGVKSLFDHE